MNIRVMSSALAIGAVLCGGYGSLASAADLGGDCCADLEERVAELEATTARKGNRKVSLTIYGQVTTALMFWDNGRDSDTYVVDAATESSRFGFQGEAKINSDLTAGFRIEIAALSSPSNRVTDVDDDADFVNASGDGTTLVRHAHWYLSHKQFGKLSVGRLGMATDGITEIDVSGTNTIARSGLYFANQITVGGTASPFSTFAVGNFEFDRNNAVRYDTPTFGGFSLGAAFGEDDRWDLALRYAGEHGGFRIAAGAAYAVDAENQPGGDSGELAAGEERQIVSGSVSVLHTATGLFVTGAAAHRHRDRPGNAADGGEETYWHLRGGITKNWFGIGNTALYAEYHDWRTDLNNANDADTSIWGAGIVQHLDAAAMELFIGYKNHSVDLVSGAPTDDTHLVISGARIRF